MYVLPASDQLGQNILDAYASLTMHSERFRKHKHHTET